MVVEMCLSCQVLAASTTELKFATLPVDVSDFEFSGSLTFPKVATFDELTLLSKVPYLFKSCHLAHPGFAIEQRPLRQFACTLWGRTKVIKDTFSLSGALMPCC